ncbi:MAG: hypothetical protein K2M76_07945 [Muribaculaceae bacterium]|nr:hypothetical protein [Muribaculaceae bacterium]
MKNYHLKLIAVAIVAGLMSCTSQPSANDNLDSADQALSAGDYESTQSACDELMHSCFDGLSVDQLCHMSVIYLKLAERAPEHDNTDMAVKCYRKALGINPDSVSIVLSSLPVEDLQYTAILHNLVRAGNTDIAAEADSIPSDFE